MNEYNFGKLERKDTYSSIWTGHITLNNTSPVPYWLICELIMFHTYFGEGWTSHSQYVVESKEICRNGVWYDPFYILFVWCIGKPSNVQEWVRYETMNNLILSIIFTVSFSLNLNVAVEIAQNMQYKDGYS